MSCTQMLGNSPATDPSESAMVFDLAGPVDLELAAFVGPDDVLLVGGENSPTRVTHIDLNTGTVTDKCHPFRGVRFPTVSDASAHR